MSTYSKENLTTMVTQRTSHAHIPAHVLEAVATHMERIFDSALTGSNLFSAIDNVLKHYSL